MLSYANWQCGSVWGTAKKAPQEPDSSVLSQTTYWHPMFCMNGENTSSDEIHFITVCSSHNTMIYRKNSFTYSITFKIAFSIQREMTMDEKKVHDVKILRNISSCSLIPVYRRKFENSSFVYEDCDASISKKWTSSVKELHVILYCHDNLYLPFLHAISTLLFQMIFPILHFSSSKRLIKV